VKNVKKTALSGNYIYKIDAQLVNFRWCKNHSDKLVLIKYCCEMLIDLTTHTRHLAKRTCSQTLKVTQSATNFNTDIYSPCT